MWNISLNLEAATSKDTFHSLVPAFFGEMCCYYKSILWLEASYFSYINKPTQKKNNVMRPYQICHWFYKSSVIKLEQKFSCLGKKR